MRINCLQKRLKGALRDRGACNGAILLVGLHRMIGRTLAGSASTLAFKQGYTRVLVARSCGDQFSCGFDI